MALDQSRRPFQDHQDHVPGDEAINVSSRPIEEKISFELKPGPELSLISAQGTFTEQAETLAVRKPCKCGSLKCFLYAYCQTDICSGRLLVDETYPRSQIYDQTELCPQTKLAAPSLSRPMHMKRSKQVSTAVLSIFFNQTFPVAS